MCHDVFNNPTELREHEQRHKYPGDYACMICAIMFSSDADRVRHTEDIHQVRAIHLMAIPNCSFPIRVHFRYTAAYAVNMNRSFPPPNHTWNIATGNTTEKVDMQFAWSAVPVSRRRVICGMPSNHHLPWKQNANEPFILQFSSRNGVRKISQLDVHRVRRNFRIGNRIDRTHRKPSATWAKKRNRIRRCSAGSWGTGIHCCRLRGEFGCIPRKRGINVRSLQWFRIIPRSHGFQTKPVLGRWTRRNWNIEHL